MSSAAAVAAAVAAPSAAAEPPPVSSVLLAQSSAAALHAPDRDTGPEGTKQLLRAAAAADGKRALAASEAPPPVSHTRLTHAESDASSLLPRRIADAIPVGHDPRAAANALLLNGNGNNNDPLAAPRTADDRWGGVGGFDAAAEAARLKKEATSGAKPQPVVHPTKGAYAALEASSGAAGAMAEEARRQRPEWLGEVARQEAASALALAALGAEHNPLAHLGLAAQTMTPEQQADAAAAAATAAAARGDRFAYPQRAQRRDVDYKPARLYAD